MTLRHLLLVDGNNVFFRAYSAMPPLSHDGMPTHGIKGFVNIVRGDLKAHKATHLLIAWDGPGPTFRHRLYPEYKANRGPRASRDEDWVRQLHWCQKLCEAYGWPQQVAEGVEADDLLASAARHWPGTVTIRSNDKDYAQALSPTVRQATKQWGLIGPEEVRSLYGVPPRKFTQWLALVGDSSDNVPGVKGCGPAKASKWLQAYGSLSGINRFAEDLSERDYDAFQEFWERRHLSRKLLTFRTDLKTTPPDLRPEDRQETRKLHAHLGFKE